MRKDPRTDKEIEEAVDRMLAARRTEEQERKKSFERSWFRFVLILPVSYYLLSLAAQIFVPVFAESSVVLAAITYVMWRLHLFSLFWIGWEVIRALGDAQRQKVIGYIPVLVFGIISCFFIAQPLEERLRVYLFAEAVTVDARITEVGYKGQGVGQRVKFSYEWNGKFHADYMDFTNEYFFANQSRFKKGKTLPLRISRRMPSLYRFED